MKGERRAKNEAIRHMTEARSEVRVEKGKERGGRKVAGEKRNGRRQKV